MSLLRSLSLIGLVIITLTGCVAPAANMAGKPAEPEVQKVQAAAEVLPSATVLPTSVPTATLAPSATPAPVKNSASSPTATTAPSATPAPLVYGPDTFPANINPLSGLPVSDPAKLALPPALISISNFPVTARPQFGLSVTPFVYEVYVGYGMTRFLAAVYGELTASDGKPAVFGPIRSGRLPYEPLRMLLNGFLMIASGDEKVLNELKLYSNVWNPASNDVNGVSVTGEVVENLAKQYQTATGKPALNGLVFDARPPQGGKPGKQLWIPYGGANQVIWKYDSASDGYVRFQDNYDGVTYIQATDQQTQKPLVYENVIVLFAAHRALQAEKIEIGLAFVKQAPALLFRDGKMQEIFWSSQDAEYYQKNGKLRMLRFVDAQGNPVPLKPGQTWVQVVTSGAPVFETPDSMTYADLYNKKVPGSGAWGVQFWQPVPEK